MWTKLAIIAALGVAIWIVFLRARAPRVRADQLTTRRDARPPRRRAASDLTPCPVCGAYREKGEICECDRNPTP